MPVISQILLIFSVCLAAEGISSVLPFTFPPSILSMVFLLLFLGLKVIKPEKLSQVNDFFAENMAMFFIPACVGILKYTDVLMQNFWAVVLISLLTTPVVFFVTGQAVQLTMKLLRKWRKSDDSHS